MFSIHKSKSKIKTKQRYWNNVVVCCIAKNEELYIVEWIMYHLALGFQMIYIYDNNNRPNILPRALMKNKCYLAFKDKIRIIHFPGPLQQNPAYNHFLKYFSHLWRWVAFFDCDEFIVLKHISLKQLLLQRCQQGALAIHWRLFGDNRQKTYEPKNVTERFISCDVVLNKHIKCICVCDDIYRIDNPHFPILKPNKIQHDCKGRICNGPSNNVGLRETNMGIYINHYFCKTREEWKYKKRRGNADNSFIRPDNDFDRHNKNMVVDNYAEVFYKNVCSRLCPT